MVLQNYAGQTSIDIYNFCFPRNLQELCIRTYVAKLLSARKSFIDSIAVSRTELKFPEDIASVSCSVYNFLIYIYICIYIRHRAARRVSVFDLLCLGLEFWGFTGMLRF